MNLDLANLVGLAGSALMVVAYAYSNMARQLNFLIFNLLNLVGSLLLIWSLTVHFNMASMALEIDESFESITWSRCPPASVTPSSRDRGSLKRRARGLTQSH